MKTLIDLNRMGEVKAGLILLGPTGVTYNHQAHGTSCRQMKAEGSFVPLADLDLSEEPEAEPLQNLSGLLWERDDLNKVRTLCKKVGLPFEPDSRPEGMAESGEAWVIGWIRTGDKGWNTLPPHMNAAAVLLWDNSD